MAEYIDREELERTLKDTYYKLSGKSPYFYKGFAYARETIRQRINNADVAPVRHGRWENGKCTGCGVEPSWLLEDGESNLAQWVWDEGLDFCPGCGARMDGEDEK